MLNEFKNNFLGGSRSNRFEIEGFFPTGGSFTKFHVRSTIIPQLTTKTISYDYFGRKYHYPGEKEYSTWAFVVLDDLGNGDLWKRFQTWQNTINNNVTNVSATTGSGSDYKAYNWKIKHLQMNGESSLKEFTMHGCWPTQIQPVTLNMTSPNTFNTFNVTIVYDYIEIQDVTRRL